MGKRTPSDPPTTDPLATEPPRLRLWKVVAVLLVAAAWGYLFFGEEGGWIELQDHGARLAELEAEAARLEAQNDSMRQILHRLQNDPAYLEKFAREELGMARPGERLYRILRPDAPGGQ